jgi:hypothetical protein
MMYKRQTRLKRTSLVEGRVGIASLDNHGLLGLLDLVPLCHRRSQRVSGCIAQLLPDQRHHLFRRL